MAAARHGFPLLVSALQGELEVFIVIFFLAFVGGDERDGARIPAQVQGPLRSLGDVPVLTDYLYLENMYLSEPTKSMDWTRLFHFSLEELC